ncbi:MAG: hypothetical protein ACK4S4_15555 [Pyrinomonadaceae bacterium]
MSTRTFEVDIKFKMTIAVDDDAFEDDMGRPVDLEDIRDYAFEQVHGTTNEAYAHGESYPEDACYMSVRHIHTIYTDNPREADTTI